MQSLIVTCHECKAEHTFYTVEWPPRMFVCSNCSSVFGLRAVNAANEPIFDTYGFCRYQSS